MMFALVFSVMDDFHISQHSSSPESDVTTELRETEELAHSSGLPLCEERATAEAKKQKKPKYTKEKSPEAGPLLNN